MFNFTTQTVYNAIETTGANKNMWVASNSKKPALRIGNTRFDADDILDIQVKKPTVENLAEVEFSMEPLITQANGSNMTGRFVLYIGLSMNAQDAFYANPFVYKGKPLTIEFPVNATDDGDAVAQKIVKIAKKYLLLVMGTEEIITVEAVASTNGGSPTPAQVKFKCVNGYQQIKKAVLQYFDPGAKTVDCCTNQGEYVDLIVGVPAVYTTNANGVATVLEKKLDEDGNKVDLASNEVPIAPGLEAFCDYNWIIHNLRMPTAANTGFWAPTRHEMPIVGQQYTQFIIRICKERDGISGEIVGARAKSVTTHVLYVAGNAAKDSSVTTTPADKVYKELYTLASAKIKAEADTKLVAPFGA